jgi:hypothetical protein
VFAGLKIVRTFAVPYEHVVRQMKNTGLQLFRTTRKKNKKKRSKICKFQKHFVPLHSLLKIVRLKASVINEDRHLCSIRASKNEFLTLLFLHTTYGKKQTFLQEILVFLPFSFPLIWKVRKNLIVLCACLCEESVF